MTNAHMAIRAIKHFINLRRLSLVLWVMDYEKAEKK